MRVSVRVFWEHKDGHRRDQYEDAFWPYWPGSVYQTVGQSVCFAVADGATEAAFSRLWARSLVLFACAWRAYPWPDERIDVSSALAGLLDNRAKEWSRKVFQSGKQLPWFVVEKAMRGAFSTLLRLALSNGTGGNRSKGNWAAFAVGDSCLVQIRAGALTESWPIAGAEGFGYRPVLLSTDPNRNTPLWSNPSGLYRSGEWRVGDEFVLMTDAIAEWYFRLLEAGCDPLQPLPLMASDDEQFSQFVRELRQSGTLRNDDVTLIRIQILDEI